MASIQNGRHYEISSIELANWLDLQGSDHWWNVDGDPFLTGRLPFPCPGDELSTELRKINRTLLVEAPNDPEAKGHMINATKLGALARYMRSILSSGTLSNWANDRFFYLSWKGSPHEWILAEDSVTAKQMREDVVKAK